MNRKEFLIFAGSTALLSVLPSKIKNGRRISIGLIGCGNRGKGLLKLLLNRDDVFLTSICDIDSVAIEESLSIFEEVGLKNPKVYSSSENSYIEMIEQEYLDGVVIATPWEWHVPMAVVGMKKGVTVGVEVPACYTLDQADLLLKTYLDTGSQFMLLENVCFRQDVLVIQNMINKNVFGELVYAQCGYQHDLRKTKLGEKQIKWGEGASGEAAWRTKHSIIRNGDLYPTHGIGPVAKWFGINKNNKFKTITSFATKSRGLSAYIKSHDSSKSQKEQVFKLGDIVTSVITCENEENIVMVHDTNLPRPYSLGFRVQGTKGIWEQELGISIEGRTENTHHWEDLQNYYTEFNDFRWQKNGSKAKKTGHYGADFFVIDEFVNCVRDRKEPYINIYDALAWSVLSPLSEISISEGSIAVDVPDYSLRKTNL